MDFQRNQPSVLRAWTFYDWANSVYSLAITSAIFPVYYNSVTREAFGGDLAEVFGFRLQNTVAYSYALSLSFLLVAIASPLLSGVADYGGLKKRMMKVFTYVGSLACAGLFFFRGNNIEYGLICSLFASIGFAGSLVFYNAFLPEIATYDRFDKLSAQGFAMGYIGSVVHLIICLAMVLNPLWFGLAGSGEASRFSFLLVGIWWVAFAQIPFRRLPGGPLDVTAKKEGIGFYLKKGFHELQLVFKALKHQPPAKRFLVSFFFYNTGVQTVMYLAALFGEKELNLGTAELIGTILGIQLVAIGGAHLFAFISKVKGNKYSLMIMLFIWIGICTGAYFVRTSYQFYVLAIVVGLVMGGIQSLSRSTYSKLIPAASNDTASYFSFYDVTEKVSIVLGTFSYGLVEQLTGSMRGSSLAMGCFFVVGILCLSRFSLPKTSAE